MFIKSFLDSKIKVKTPLEKINYLNKEEMLLLASTVSTYFHFLGAKRENQNLKEYLIENNLNEDRLITIEATLQEEITSWGKKYYSNKGTFGDTQIKHIKLIINHNNLTSKNEYPCYFIYKSPFIYHDGDFTNGSIAEFLGERRFYIHNQPFFLNMFTNFRFLTWQREGREAVSKFETMFNHFIQHFTFETISIQKIDSIIIEENSNLSLYASSYLEQAFFVQTKEGQQIYFKDIDKSDLEFLLLLGEIFTRVFSIVFMNARNKDDKVLDIQNATGVFLAYQEMSNSHISQITKTLPNLQYFFIN